MSSLKKKIRKKKKKKQADNGITPQRHEREGNLNYFSEEIAKEMIEKVISLSLSSHFVKKVDKKFAQFCNKLMVKKINNLVEIIHINRDKDDFDIDNIDINSYISYYKTDTNLGRYKNIIHNHICELQNEKVEDNLMTIANIPKEFRTYMNAYNKKIEDCLNKSTIVSKNKYLKKNKFYNYNIDIKTNNYWGGIPQPKSTTTDRTSSNFNCYIPKKQENYRNSISSIIEKNEDKTQEKSNSQKKSIFHYKYFKSLSSKKYNNLNESSKEKKDNNYDDDNYYNKNKKITMIKLPCYPIENIEIRKESKEIINLRKEQLELISRKEKELQELKNNKNRVNNVLEKNKNIKNGKYTVDIEGKLISINRILPENLLKEFCPIISNQKEVKTGKTIEDIKKEKKMMENRAKKNIEYNEEDHPYKLYLSKTIYNDSLNDIKEVNKDKDGKEKEKENSKDMNNSKINNISINNNSNNQRKISAMNSDINDFNSSIIAPSGSNFNIINPSVGVKIKEKSKIKSGGFNFYEKFHKFSINEFNKTLQNTLELSRLNLMKKQNEGYMVSTNKISNLKQMISTKEEKDLTELNNNTLDTNKNINNINIKKNILSEKTFTNGFNNNKTIIKSNSEIFGMNDKFPKLKQILFHDDENDKTMIDIPKNEKQSFENILKIGKYNYMGKNKKNRSMIEENKYKNKSYFDVDNFNKKLIMGNLDLERKHNRNRFLPKISGRKNINYNNTMIQFHRTRIKKGSMDEILSKINNNKNNNIVLSNII